MKSTLTPQSSWSIAGKLNLVLIGTALLILAGAGLFLGNWLSNKLEQRSLLALQNTNRQVVDMIDAYASVLESSVHMVGAQFAASLPGGIHLDEARNEQTAGKDFPALMAGEQLLNNHLELVDRFTQTTGAVATLFVRKEQDFFRIATSVKKENGERALATNLGEKHPAYATLMAGQPYTGRATLFGREYMTNYLPLFNDAKAVVGVAFVGIDFTEGLASLKQKIRALKVGDTGYVYVLDAQKEPGKAVVHPAAEGKNLIGVKDANGREIIKEIITQKEGVIHYPWINTEQGETSEREKIAVLNHFARWGWVVGSGSYLDEFLSDVQTIRLQFLVIGGIVAVALVIAVLLSTRYWVSQPLAEALQVTRRVAEGDLTVTSTPRAQDEVGQLIDAANHMTANLRSMISEINHGIQTLAHDANQLAGSAHSVARSSGQQSDSATSMASAVEEMTVSINQVASHAQEAQAMAEESGEVSTNSVAVIDSAIKEMTRIADTVRSSSQVVSQLGDQSQQIAGIVNVIREIADQTNLLALNAAIEAARAGEQGRGFAVVADEVRKLAERTANSTQEITAMVEQIQAGARHAVESMQTGVRQVEAGVQLAGEAGVRIGDLKSSAGSISTAVISISEALQQQTSAGDHICRNVETIAAQAEQNHTIAQQASAASAELERLAGQLRQSISRFKT